MNSEDIEYNDYSYALDINDNSIYSAYIGYRGYKPLPTYSWFKLGIVIFLILFGIPLILSGVYILGSGFLGIWAILKVKEWYERTYKNNA